MKQHLIDALNELSALCREKAETWYHNPLTGERIFLNKGERYMLIVTELAEAFEGERKNLMDDKLPLRKAPEVELADALIRIFDYAGEYHYDLGGALAEKLEYNEHRPDHKPTARLGANGKQF
jgi:NTP pyrophosphatase (non-canonical NTP hydrolase)